jgi:geranylgeranyl reductase family protein
MSVNTAEQATRNITCDVIICGGGPAGSTCALALAGSGLSVVVIDKESFPRDKICGDAIAPYVPKVLNTIHPKYKVAALAFTEKVDVSTCRVVAPNGRHLDLVSPESGFIATRMAWDHFLYTLASAEPDITYFLNEQVTDVVCYESGVTVSTATTVFKAQLVIGCDGAHSIVNKKLAGTKPDLEHYSGAVRAYYKNVAGLTENTYELHFLKDTLPGYFWIFPVKDNIANVGLGMLSSEISKRKINLRETMEQIIKQDPTINARFKNAELRGKIEGFGLPLGSRKVTVSGHRFLMCGDAASLIDPATGEGIGQAMISGRYAGWQVKRCFKENNFSAQFMKQYDKELYAKLWKDHRRRYLLRKFMLGNAALLNRLFTIISKNKQLKKLVAKFI